MEKDFDLHKVYIKTTLGHYTEYVGGMNFADGRRKCPRCEGNMSREPLGVCYINVEKGKILITTTSAGRMIVVKTEPDYQWQCSKCPHAISTGLQNAPLIT
jgi:hypothetical protein